MRSETNMRIKGPRNAEVNGMEYNLCKNVEVLGTKAHHGPTWLNVKCVFGKNLDKSYHLCASTEKVNSRWRTETIPEVELCLYFSISSLIFSLCCVLLGGRHRAAELATDSTGQCSPWPSGPWCGPSCRSYRGCAHPRGSSLGCLLRIEDHHSPHSGSSAHGNHGPEPQCGRSPPGLGPAW